MLRSNPGSETLPKTIFIPFPKTKTTDGNLLRNAKQVPICSRGLENWYYAFVYRYKRKMLMKQRKNWASVQHIVEAGGDAMFVETDVTQAKEVQALVDRPLDRYGRLDCAFNTAGSGKGVRLIDLSEEEWEQEIAVNHVYLDVTKGTWTLGGVYEHGLINS